MNDKRAFNGSRVSAGPWSGPRGGMTKWAATLDGELFLLHGEPFTADTKRGARLKLIDYARRHPEKF